MPSLEKEALRLVELAYQAVADPAQWPLLLEALAAAVRAEGGLLRQVDYRNDRVGFSQTLGYEESYVRAYREHYIHLDHYRDILLRQPVGAVLTSDAVMAPEVRRKTVYFNEYEQPQDRIHVLGSVLARDEEALVYLGLHRGERGQAFAGRDLRLIRLLLPHLAGAVRLQGLLAACRQGQLLIGAAIDRLRVGVLLTDAAARPFLVNHAAERLMARTRAWAIRPDGLTLAKPADTARLRHLIATAAATTAGSDTMSGSDLLVMAPDGLTPIQFWITPLARSHLGSDLTAPSACAAVFVACPGATRLPWRRVAVQYGLTQAEARLAVALCEGLSVEEAAARFGVSLATVRTQLKAVLAKTGTRRQAELVGRLMCGVLAQCATDEADT
jgi:DNA-binding CsgD family transcriptional regulator